MVTVPAFCVEGRFARPACHPLRKSQQACVVSNKPGGKMTISNAHPTQGERSLAHGGPCAQKLLCDFVSQKGGSWHQGCGEMLS